MCGELWIAVKNWLFFRVILLWTNNSALSSVIAEKCSHFESVFERSLMVQYIVWKLEILLGEYLTLFCNCTLDLRSLLLFIPGCHWLGFVLLLFYCSEWAIIIASGLKRNQLNNNWWSNALCLVKFLRRLHKTQSSFG